MENWSLNAGTPHPAPGFSCEDRCEVLWRGVRIQATEMVQRWRQQGVPSTCRWKATTPIGSLNPYDTPYPKALELGLQQVLTLNGMVFGDWTLLPTLDRENSAKKGATEGCISKCFSQPKQPSCWPWPGTVCMVQRLRTDATVTF